MDFTKLKFVSLDLETTGLEAATDQIIEIGLVVFDFNGELARFSSLVNYQGSLDPVVARLTGINEAELKTAPGWDEINRELKKYLDDDVILIGHNIAFDLAFLSQKGWRFEPERVLDSYDLATLFLFAHESYSLEALSHYIKWEYNAHRAVEDAVAVMAIFNYFIAKLRYLSAAGLERIIGISRRGDWRYNFIFQYELARRQHHPVPVTPRCRRPLAKLTDQAVKGVWREVGDWKEPAKLELWEADFWQAAERLPGGVIMVSDSVFRQLRNSYTGALFVDVQSNYICRHQLKRLITKSSLTALEIAVLVKIIMKIDQGYWDGYLSDLRFGQDQRLVVDSLRCGAVDIDHQNCFFSHKLSPKSDLVVTTGGGQEYLTVSGKSLLVYVDDLLLEDGLTFMTKNYFWQDSWESFLVSWPGCRRCNGISKKTIGDWHKKMSILWGLTGLLVRSRGVEDYNSVKFDLTPSVRRDLAMSKIQAMAGELLADLRPAGTDWELCPDCRRQFLVWQRWLANLANEREDVLKAYIGMDDRLIWETAYLDFIELIGVWQQKYDRVILAARSLFVDDRCYFQSFLADGSQPVARWRAETPGLCQVETEFSGLDGDVPDLSSLEEDKLNLLIFSSKEKVKNAYHQLIRIKDGQFYGKINTLSHKTAEQLKSGLLLASLRECRQISLFKGYFDWLILESLPFDVPGDPLLGYRSLRFQDENFVRYVIPRMLTKISYLTTLAAGGRFTVADRRVNQKSYGLEVIRLLNNKKLG